MTEMKMTPKMSKLIPLSKAVSVIGTAGGTARPRTYLESEPFPHFEPHPTIQAAIIRIEANGARTAGRFVDRRFVPLD